MKRLVICVSRTDYRPNDEELTDSVRWIDTDAMDPHRKDDA